jgi:hypothetical protein
VSPQNFKHRVRERLGDASVPLFAWLRRRQVAEIQTALCECWRLCEEWHRVADADYEAGVDFDDPSGAGHLAYESYEAEVSRLHDVPLPPHLAKWYGWWAGGAMSVGQETFGALASMSCLSRKVDRTIVPLSRREWFFVGGWRYSPPMTEREIAWWRLVMRATERIGNRYTETWQVGRMTSSHTIMGGDYFEELAANMHEIEAEPAAIHRPETPK